MPSVKRSVETMQKRVKIVENYRKDSRKRIETRHTRHEPQNLYKICKTCMNNAQYKIEVLK